MGQTASAARATLIEKQVAEKHAIEERCHILEKMLQARLEKQMEVILSGHRNDQEIDTGTIVQLVKQCRIIINEQTSDKIKDGIIDFFCADFIGGLENIVEGAADTVLMNESLGEYETTDMFIVWTANALLRCDAYYYRWNFASTEVIKDTEGVAGILLVKRVIDLTKTDPQVLTWAITEQATRAAPKNKQTNEITDPDEVQAEVKKMISAAMKVIESVVGMQAKVRQQEAGGGKSEE